MNSRLVTILTSQVFLIFILNLVDRDLTEYQITQILTPSQLHATSGADKGNPTVHTHATRGLEQTRSIRLFNQTSYPSFVVFRSMQCVSDLCNSVEGSMTGTAWLRSTHRRCFSCCIWYAYGKPGELKQIVNIPVTQIVDEITEMNIPVSQIVEEIAEVKIPVPQIVKEITELNIPVSQIVEEIAEVKIPVPQIVKEIAEVSKSSIVWRSIPNLYFEEIKVFPG